MTSDLSARLRFSTAPYEAQVALFDPGVESAYPDWGDGSAEVVWSASGVAVETRPDGSGRVMVEVDAALAPDPGWRAVAAGEIVVTSGRIAVGSVAGSDLRYLRIKTGRQRVEVHAHGERGEVDGVRFLLPQSIAVD